jgi:hypothetical protein
LSINRIIKAVLAGNRITPFLIALPPGNIGRSGPTRNAVSFEQRLGPWGIVLKVESTHRRPPLQTLDTRFRPGTVHSLCLKVEQPGRNRHIRPPRPVRTGMTR